MQWNTLGFSQEKIFFENLLTRDSLSHGYLFTGQEMIGKKTFAEELARKANKQETDAQQQNIQTIQVGQDETSISIESIRSAKDFLSHTAYGGTKKFILIDDAHLMPVEAQNALLKILEEPSQQSHLILITHAPHALLTTIRSRCQQIAFNPHAKQDLQRILANSDLNEAQMHFLVDFSNGRIGLLHKIVKDKSFENIKEYIQELSEILQAPLNIRLSKAQQLAEDDHLSQKILYWSLYLQSKLVGVKNEGILRNLLKLCSIITQPQFNKRYALEQFVLDISTS